MAIDFGDLSLDKQSHLASDGRKLDARLAHCAVEQICQVAAEALQSILVEYSPDTRFAALVYFLPRIFELERQRQSPLRIEFLRELLAVELQTMTPEQESLDPISMACLRDARDQLELGWEGTEDCGIDKLIAQYPQNVRPVLFESLLPVECSQRYAIGEFADPLLESWRQYKELCLTSAEIGAAFCRAFNLHVPGQSVLGEYALDSLAGIGGMGVIYKAHNTRSNWIYALKCIRPDQQTAETRSLFRQEARTAERLEATRFITALDGNLREDAEEPFYVMRFVEGGTSLADLVQGKAPIPVFRAAKIVRELANTLHFLHGDSRRVHCDLKPANILLDARNGLFVTDLGLSRPIGSTIGNSFMGGTPAYVAPEAVGGWPGVSCDERIDVWGCCAVLYALLTKRAPFAKRTSNEEINETLRRVREEPLVLPSKINPKAPAALQAVCLKGLTKNPEHRYANARDLADDLSRFLEKRPVKARPLFTVREIVHKVRVPALWAFVSILLATLLVNFELARRTPASLARAHACEPVVWKNSYLSDSNDAPHSWNLDGFEIVETSRFWNFSKWRPVDPKLIRSQPINPVFCTNVIRLKKRLDQPDHDRLIWQFRTSGVGIQARCEQFPFQVIEFHAAEKMPEDTLGSNQVSVSVWELQIDLSNVGNDGREFPVTFHTIWWNAFQDQQLGNLTDWVATRLDYQPGTVNDTILLPKGKLLTSWGFSSFPVGGSRPLPSQESPGTFTDTDGGMIYWNVPNPRRDWVYRVDWTWKDR
jgi:serine/threonine protein kinase